MTSQQAPSPAGTMEPSRNQYDALNTAIEYLERSVLVPSGLGLPTFIPAFATAAKPNARVWCHWGTVEHDAKGNLNEKYKGLRATRGFAWKLESGQQIGTLYLAPRHLTEDRLKSGQAYMDLLIGMVMVADLAETKGGPDDKRRTHTGYLDSGIVHRLTKCGISAGFKAKATDTEFNQTSGWIHQGEFKIIANGPFHVAFEKM